MRKLIAILLYCLSMVLVILVLLEISVRIWGYAGMYLYDPIYMPYDHNPEIPYVMKPNLRQVRAHGNIWVNTDSLGLRSKVPGRTYGEKQPHEYRIAFVGDSVTFGVGVPGGKTYPELVEKSLTRRQPRCRITVFNFAVSSYSVKEMAATLKYRVPEVTPDLVIMGVIIDDFDTSRAPRVDKWGFNTHRGASQLINQYPTLKLMLRKIHLSYLIRDILSRTIMTRSHNYRSPHAETPGMVARSYKYIKEFKRLAEEHGYRYFILTLPSLAENGQQFNGLIKDMQRDKINYFDVSYLTRGFTNKEFQASKYDWHPSALIHQTIGTLLSRYIWCYFLPKLCLKK